MSDERTFRPARRLFATAIAFAAAGWVTLAVGLWAAPRATAFAYLAAYVYLLTLVVGSLFLVMIAHASGARWFVVVRRLSETVVATLPLVALLLVPILVGVGTLYSWVPPLPRGASHHFVEVVNAKRAFLNVPFFVARAVAYFASWLLVGGALVRWSLRQDADPAAAPVARATALSAGGLMLVGFTFSFAMFDWVMSLDPAWSSTVFAVYLFAGGMIAALAALALLAHAGERAGYLRGMLAAAHVHAIGRLLLTFVVFWTYIFYSQSYLVWIADLPHEADWYLERWKSGWAVALVALLFGQFAIPFALLLSRRLKRDSRALARVGVWLLAMHYLDVFWLVVPALGGPPGAHLGWDLAALAALGGSAVAFGAWRARGRWLVARNDPRLLSAVEYRSP